jgi:mRNA degradation ribonuclease J1/J2
VEAVLVVTELGELLLKAVQEVQEEEDTSTSVTRETHQTMVVLLGPRTFLVVSRSMQSATLWVRTAATKRVERTDALRERECKSQWGLEGVPSEMHMLT